MSLGVGDVAVTGGKGILTTKWSIIDLSHREYVIACCILALWNGPLLSYMPSPALDLLKLAAPGMFAHVITAI